jgi:hypothetical protein
MIFTVLLSENSVARIADTTDHMMSTGYKIKHKALSEHNPFGNPGTDTN